MDAPPSNDPRVARKKHTPVGANEYPVHIHVTAYTHPRRRPWTRAFQKRAGWLAPAEPPTTVRRHGTSMEAPPSRGAMVERPPFSKVLAIVGVHWQPAHTHSASIDAPRFTE